MMSDLRMLAGQQTPSGEADLNISFEVFPAKTEAAADKLIDAVKALVPCKPQFVSVTYGAGGATRDRTLSTLRRIADETGLAVAGHLTCVDATRAEIDAVIRQYGDHGVTGIVALRGDPREGVGAKYTPPENGYRSSPELVEGIRAIGDFDISVSAYPEKHPETPDFDADLDMLAQKEKAGANRALTQFFFDTPVFASYRNRVAARGIELPIVPGIMPIVNFTQVCRFAKACGTSVPDGLGARFADLDDDKEARFAASVAFASEQVVTLYDAGVRDFHFYTMNRSDLVMAVCQNLVDHCRQENGAASAAA